MTTSASTFGLPTDRKINLGFVLVALFSFVLMGAQCQPGQAGDSCTVTGDGFTRKDSCAEMCLAWDIRCPNGATLTPQVCSGAPCGAGQACPPDQICLQIDSFAQNSRCVPTWVCQSGGGQSSAAPQDVDWTLIPVPVQPEAPVMKPGDSTSPLQR